MAEAVAGSGSEQAIAAATEALGGRDDPAFAGLSSDQRLLRSFDLATMAVRALTTDRPLALLIDDMQWSDEDSLRLLRYVIRTEGGSPIFLMFSVRPEELATVTEAVTLLADMERMRVIRRLKIARFSVVETSEFLRQVLGGQVEPATASTIHGQAEGVPFIVEEIGRAYREAGMLQQIGDTWTLTRNAERLAPSAVRTLIQRRAAHLPIDTKTALAEAALLGRHFSLKDLREVRVRIAEGERGDDLVALGDLMAPAVAAGLLVEQPEDAPADYTFPARAGPRVRGGHLGTGSAARDPWGDRRAPADRRAGARDAPAPRPPCARGRRRAGVRSLLDASRGRRARGACTRGGPTRRRDRAAAGGDAAGAARPADRAGRRPGDAPAARGSFGGTGGARRPGRGPRRPPPGPRYHPPPRGRAAAVAAGRSRGGARRRVRALAVQRDDRAAELAACVELGQALVHAGLGGGSRLRPPRWTSMPPRGVRSRGPTGGGARRHLDAGGRDTGAGGDRHRRMRGWFVEQVEEGDTCR